MFAHSLELEVLIEETCGTDPEVLELLPAMRRRFNHFREKFIIEDRFSLMSAEQLNGELKQRLVQLLSEMLSRPVNVMFVSRAAVVAKENGADLPDVPRAAHLLKVAQTSGIRQMIDRACCDSWKAKTYFGRSIEDIISSMLGKRSMQEILDAGFGHSFANLFLRDSLALWDSYVCSILSGDKIRAKRKGGIIDFYTKTILIGEDKSIPDATILCFTA